MRPAATSGGDALSGLARAFLRRRPSATRLPLVLRQQRDRCPHNQVLRPFEGRPKIGRAEALRCAMAGAVVLRIPRPGHCLSSWQIIVRRQHTAPASSARADVSARVLTAEIVHTGVFGNAATSVGSVGLSRHELAASAPARPWARLHAAIIGFCRRFSVWQSATKPAP
jgi:hypothetical protein